MNGKNDDVTSLYFQNLQLVNTLNAVTVTGRSNYWNGQNVGKEGGEISFSLFITLFSLDWLVPQTRSNATEQLLSKQVQRLRQLSTKSYLSYFEDGNYSSSGKTIHSAEG